MSRDRDTPSTQVRRPAVEKVAATVILVSLVVLVASALLGVYALASLVF